ncbi:peptidase [Mycolicibacterium komossense]|uniref:Peptidase n=1 Tax=Mycolicibacterium komossense TaxID=1779 RepID=A0ABT3CI95_9MYCO|nr:peptidase [Mycolicibacterium komossense]MCV7229077.1 peptidase [Mycolicibacterium komossense]
MPLFALVCAALTASCSPTVIDGHAASMLYDPDRVSGLPAVGGPNGVRYNAPRPVGEVEGTNNGDDDRLALLAANDIEEFWTKSFPSSFGGRPFVPVETLISYDSTNARLSPIFCGQDTYGSPNAHYCSINDSLAWDRGSLIPGARQFYSDIAAVGILAHEFGHAVQHRAGLVDESTPGLVREQQADCFAGVYLRWVADGRSTRFTLNTTDGLDRVLAGALYGRDAPDQYEGTYQGHGSALDRIGAFQEGFDAGAATCSAIDTHEIAMRQKGLPQSLQYDYASATPGETPIDDDSLATLMELLGQIFHPKSAPALTVGGTPACPDAKPSPPASYCPSTNTINVDLAALQQIGAYSDEKSNSTILRGDDTAFSIVTSRYMLAMQHERSLSLTGDAAALRTACLTGVAQRNMAQNVSLPSGRAMVLAAGDLDEAVSGLLVKPIVASDTNGTTVPAGFTRIFAFRSGLMGDDEQCYQRFP